MAPVEIRDLSKHFGAVAAVNHLSFEDRARSRHGIPRTERGREEHDVARFKPKTISGAARILPALSATRACWLELGVRVGVGLDGAAYQDALTALATDCREREPNIISQGPRLGRLVDQGPKGRRRRYRGRRRQAASLAGWNEPFGRLVGSRRVRDKAEGNRAAWIDVHRPAAPGPDSVGDRVVGPGIVDESQHPGTRATRAARCERTQARERQHLVLVNRASV